MATLIISDLHLSRERPEKLAVFERLLTHAAARADALYILGDLFEVWVGDDDDTSPHPEILQQLARYSANGTALFVMRGNRDFLMGEGFARATGCTLLPDTVQIDLYGACALLMHGDLLCTGDVDYQAFRRKVRDPAWQRRFLSRPLWLRKLLGRLARLGSRLASGGKPENIMDVQQNAVVETLRARNVALLIHGHTHRPGIHDVTLDGREARRIVLGDWYEQDSVLVCDPAGQRLLRVSDYLSAPSYKPAGEGH
ncbi:MAG: UDP-2,3-diacylglucosamine diphosphatase [Chromatiales bacterium]